MYGTPYATTQRISRAVILLVRSGHDRPNAISPRLRRITIPPTTEKLSPYPTFHGPPEPALTSAFPFVTASRIPSRGAFHGLGIRKRSAPAIPVRLTVAPRLV